MVSGIYTDCSAVEPPVELVEVTVYMFLTDVMERPDDRPLEEAPGVFHAVCIDIAPDPFLFAVTDAFVFVFFVDAFVSPVFIRHNSCGFIYPVLMIPTRIFFPFVGIARASKSLFFEEDR